MAKDKDPFNFDRYIQQVVENNLRDLHTCIPGVIESFDSATQLASIQPLLKRKFINNQEVDLPLCINCPVMFPGAGGFVMTFPVEPGDECLIMFSERALDTWLQSGGIQLPLDTRRHSLSDAIAILGLFSQPNKLPAFFGEGIELKDVAGNTYCRIKNSGIDIKGDTDLDGNLTITELSTADDHFSGIVSGENHTHSGVTAGGGVSGPPIGGGGGPAVVLDIVDGGTGESSAQDAIDALTQVAGATDEYVLTRDTATQKAIWKVAAGAGGGEVNTASNVGTDGLGVFKQKTGVDLEFKNVAPASTKISVVANGDDIDLDVVEANISHANIIAGSGADHSGVVLNTTHRGSTGTDHSIVVANAAAAALNTTHRGSDGKDHSDVVANNAKVSNANHSGDASGDTALTLLPAAIIGKSTVVSTDADFILISDTGDSGNLKKVAMSEVRGGGDVTAAANLDTTTILVGDDGAKGIKDTGITVDGSNNISGIGTLASGSQTVTGGIIASDAIQCISTSGAAQLIVDATSSGSAATIVLRADTGGSASHRFGTAAGARFQWIYTQADDDFELRAPSSTIGVFDAAGDVAWSQNHLFNANITFDAGAFFETTQFNDTMTIDGGAIVTSSSFKMSDDVSLAWGDGLDVTAKWVNATNDFRFTDEQDADRTFLFEDWGDVRMTSPLFLAETTERTNVSGFGQLYCVNNAGTTELWFSDDNGNDTQLA